MLHPIFRGDERSDEAGEAIFPERCLSMEQLNEGAARRMTFADKAYKFFTHLELKHKLPPGVEVMNPYKERTVRECFRAFLRLHFDDTRKRVLIFGINPSRFGAGITGVAFTD